MVKLSKEKIKEYIDIDIDKDFAEVVVMSEEAFKTGKQNRLFHSLLGCFWKSGCSGYNSYDELRFHYKHIAGIIEYKYENMLDEWSKKCLWEAIKLLPLDKKQMREVLDLLKGKVLIEHSWSEAKKPNAEMAINQLIEDMFSARVDDSKMAKKFEEIMKDIGEWYE